MFGGVFTCVVGEVVWEGGVNESASFRDVTNRLSMQNKNVCVCT